MPYEPLTLAAVIQTTWDAYIEDRLPDMPDGLPEVEGVTDAMLWEDVRTGAGDDPADPLRSMSFQEAVCVDPRRVDAMVQQRINSVLYKVGDFVQEAQDWTGHEADLEGVVRNEATLDRYHYLTRLLLCRENHNGEVTADGLAETFEIMWDAGGRILAASIPMAQPPAPRQGRPTPPPSTALLMWQGLEARIAELRRSLREAREILSRASDMAPDQQASEAWKRMDIVVTNMDQTISESLRGRGAQVPEQFGRIAFGAMSVEAQRGYMAQAGHRAPGMPLDQWRRAGGRVF